MDALQRADHADLRFHRVDIPPIFRKESNVRN